MFVAFGEHGRLFVTESSGLDLYAEISAGTRKCRVRLLEDRDGDGRYESSLVFADGLVFPMGLVWRDGKLYVADPPDLVALEDVDDDGRADRRTTILSGFGHIDNGSLHGLDFGPDGLLYMTMGMPDGYKLPRGDGTFLEGRSGALIRCRPDGTRPEVVCRGFTNLVEVAFLPGGDTIGTDNWFSEPHGGLRDALVHLVDGGLYPYVPDEGTPQPVTGEPLPAVDRFPAVALSGIARHPGLGFPEEYRGNLFTAQHNARAVGRHVLEPDGSSYRARSTVFLATEDPDFRPSDVAVDADGSLIVVDTGSWYVQHCPTGRIRESEAVGGIYRVRCTGALPRSETERSAAEERERDVWALHTGGGERAVGPLIEALDDPDDDVACAAARALGRGEERSAARALAERLGSGSSRRRLAMAEGLARCGGLSELPAVWRALKAAPDRFLTHALVHAAHRLVDEAELRAALASGEPPVEAAALILLDQPPRARGLLAAENVVARAASPDESLRRAALWVLLRHPEWASAALDLARRELARVTNMTEPSTGLADLLLAFEEDPGIQELLAQTATDEGAAARRRAWAIEVMAGSRRANVPRAWVEALGPAVASAPDEVRQAAVHTAVMLQVAELDDALRAIADDEGEDRALRLDALRGVLPRRPDASRAAFELMIERLEARDQPEAMLAAAALLGRARLTDEQVQRLLQVVGENPLITPGMLRGVFAGRRSDTVVRAWIDYIETALRAGWRPEEVELRSMLEDLGLNEERREGLLALARETLESRRARLAEFEPLLSGGDGERGRAVFFGEKVACGACHRIGDEGGFVGPDLTRIGAVRAGADLLESIVWPSSTLAQGYTTHLVATKDGRVLRGVLLSQVAEVLVLREASGAETRVRRDEIEESEATATSLMPEGLVHALSREELRDLLAFLNEKK
jgi:putative membrane-bound dehydrogenase-like protein